MIKKMLLIACVVFSLSVQAEELKITVLEVKKVKYANGMWNDTEFRILCINGYKWLQSGVGNTQSTSQMFDDKNPMHYAQPISCPN